MLAYPTAAVTADPSANNSCTDIGEDTARLSCYDTLHERPPAPAADTTAEVDAVPNLAEVWELDAAHKRGTFRLLPYRANYLMPVRVSDNPNKQPSSPAPGHTLGGSLPLDGTEVKFQVSFKLKAWEDIFGDNGDLWLGYTQQSHWQLYNGNPEVSSAFRETNYEPEVMLTLRSTLDLLGWRLRLVNLGLNHQSNGQSLPLSRSWNRVYAELGFERRNFYLQLRPWIRLPESDASDDNPDIHQYLGSGDVHLSYFNAGFVYSLLGRYSGGGERGAVQFELAFPISGALKGYLQVFSGYGESLVDYNSAQNTVGLGVLLVPWQ